MVLAKWLLRVFLVCWAGAEFFGLGLTWGNLVRLLTDMEIGILNRGGDPLILGILIGLIFSTWILPDAWKLVRRAFFKYAPKPDMLIKNALGYIMDKSAWGKSQSTGSALFGASIEVRQKAANGELLVWGQPEISGTTRSPQFSLMETEISSSHWMKFELKLDAIYEPPNWHVAETYPENPNDARSQQTIKYTRLRVNRKQVLRCWPKPSVWRQTLNFFRKQGNGARQISES